MKHKAILIAFFSAAAFGIGCDKEDTTSHQLDGVKAETQQAEQKLRDYTYAQKADFVKDMQGRLISLNDDLDKLSAKMAKSSDAVKADAKPKIQELRDQADKLTKRLDTVENSSESTWSNVKADTQKAWDSLNNGVVQARQWVSDKIAP